MSLLIRKHYVVMVSLMLLCLTLVTRADEIRSLSGKIGDGLLSVEVTADKPVSAAEKIDYVDWKVFFTFPNFGLALPTSQLVQRFPSEYRDYVDSFFLEKTPFGSQLVLVLGKRAVPVKISSLTNENSFIVTIPTSSGEEGDERILVQLGFLDPPVSFLEVSPSGKAYRALPIPIKSEEVPKELEKVAETMRVEAEVPPIVKSGFESFLIPIKVAEKPKEPQAFPSEQAKIGSSEPSVKSFRRDFRIQPTEEGKSTYSYGDFVLKAKVAESAREETIEAEVLPPSEEAKEEPAPSETPTEEKASKAKPWDVKSSLERRGSGYSYEKFVHPSSKPAVEKGAQATEEASSPIVQILPEEELEKVAEEKAVELIVSDGKELKVEPAQEKGDSALISPEVATEKPEVSDEKKDSVSLSWIPESKWRAKHREREAEARADNVASPPPPKVDGRPWDVGRRRTPVSPPVSLPTTPAEALLASERITYETTQASLKEAIALLVAPTPFNVIVDEEVGDMKVTLSFRDTPLKDALDAITAAKGIMYRLVGNTIIVGQRDDIGRRLGGFETRTFVLQYADADEVKKVLIDNGLVAKENISSYYGEKKSLEAYDRSTVLSEGEGGVSAGDIKRLTGFESTARANVLVITETPERLDQIARVISNIDKKPKVVTLETTIVEINEQGMKDLGFKVEEEVTEHILEEQALSPPSTPEPGEPPGVWTPRTVPGYIALGLWFQDFFRSPLDVVFRLGTIIESGNARILSRPNIAAVDGSQAIYFAGTLIPYITRPAVETPTTFTPPQVDFQPVGITLSFKPRIDEDGLITMEVNPVVSTLLELVNLGGGAVAPKTQTRQIATTIRVRDRETFVIAGMLTETERETLRRVPILGQIPLFEKLFSRTNKISERTEVMVFVTPMIREE